MPYFQKIITYIKFLDKFHDILATWQIFYIFVFMFSPDIACSNFPGHTEVVLKLLPILILHTGNAIYQEAMKVHASVIHYMSNECWPITVC